MSFPVLLALAIGLSMDAFAVSVCIGLTAESAVKKKALTAGAYFGIFQAGMPLIGYYIAIQFAERIITYGKWIAFGVLCFLGIRIIMESIRKAEKPRVEATLEPKLMLPLAIATSIDALAVGITFAFIQVNIIIAVLFIGTVTFMLSAAGVFTGNKVGTKLKSKAELVGGVILILVALSTLI